MSKSFSLYIKARFATFWVVIITFRVKVVTFCVKKLLQFALKKLLHFALEVVTIRVNVTFCVKSCYILRRNSRHMAIIRRVHVCICIPIFLLCFNE